ncbi:MAG: cobalt ECF transporter T component CbiQ [Pseudomonadota bacterium]
MNKIENEFFNISHLDKLSTIDSPIHKLDARAKLITTAIFIIIVVSYNKYAILALLPFFLYPVVLITIGNLPCMYLLKKILIVSPFAIMVGIFNPIIDNQVLLNWGFITISAGFVSFISIIIKFILTVSAALILISLSSFNSVCYALLKLRVPKLFVVQLLFFYRYIFVLIDEAKRMQRARALRTFQQSKIRFNTFISLVGNLLVRTMDRAERINLAMSCRGFDGNIRLLNKTKFGLTEFFFISTATIFFVIFRCYNVPLVLGTLIMEIIK